MSFDTQTIHFLVSLINNLTAVFYFHSIVRVTYLAPSVEVFRDVLDFWFLHLTHQLSQLFNQLLNRRANFATGLRLIYKT